MFIENECCCFSCSKFPIHMSLSEASGVFNLYSVKVKTQHLLSLPLTINEILRFDAAFHCSNRNWIIFSLGSLKRFAVSLSMLRLFQFLFEVITSVLTFINLSIFKAISNNFLFNMYLAGCNLICKIVFLL